MQAVILLAAAAILITHPAARHSLWYDEAWSVLVVRGQPLPAVLEAARHDFHPPGYFIMLWGWAGLTGFSEFTLRYLSVLSALVVVAVTLRLATDLGRSRFVGALAALALASMPFHIRFAQEVRMYAALAALVTASMWLWWRVVRRSHGRAGKWQAVAYVLVSAAALYTHYLAIFALVLHGAYALARRARWQIVLLPTAAGLLFLPWLPVFYAQLTAPDYDSIHRHALPTTWHTISTTLVEDFFAGQTVFFLTLLALALVTAREWKPIGFLAAWGLGWLALVWGSNAFVYSFQPRNALAALPALAILAGRGLARLPRPLAVLGLVVLAGINLWRYPAYQASDSHYRDAVLEMAEGFQPGDLIFVQTNSFLHDLSIPFYLETRLPPHPPPVWLNSLPGQPGDAEFRRAFLEQVGAARRFWFLQTLPADNRWVTDAGPFASAGVVEVYAFQISLYVAP